jgi:acylphosphatase
MHVDDMSGEIQRGFTVRGRVQGVYFRAWTRGMAQELGVRGWVRNCSDGSVEAHGAADAETMREFQARLAVGPAAARVDDVGVISSESDLPIVGFEIRY